MKIVAIGGTRPEAIKFAPLMRVLKARQGIDYIQVATGQHPELFDDALAEFELAADLNLALPNAGGDAFPIEAERRIADLLRDLKPDLVLVQGDTNSAWAAACAAHALGLPIGHVEAGLRSGDPRTPWPEERNRRDIDTLSTLLFAPSAQAAANLTGPGAVFVTRNTGIDALQAIRPKLPALREDDRKRMLVTAHRSETIPALDEVCDALIAIAERDDVAIHLPVHPNPAVARRIKSRLVGSQNITLEPPLPYSELIALLCRATLVLTDSGGLQEEAPALGIPALIMRDITERPEVIASGNARLVGLNARVITRQVNRLMDDPSAYAAMATPAFPYGEGDAALRIADAIESWRRAGAI